MGPRPGLVSSYGVEQEPVPGMAACREALVPTHSVILPPLVLSQLQPVIRLQD